MKQALMAALALGATAAPVQGQTAQAMQRPTIVLVHGGFVDGSGWERVFTWLHAFTSPEIGVRTRSDPPAYWVRGTPSVRQPNSGSISIAVCECFSASTQRPAPER